MHIARGVSLSSAFMVEHPSWDQKPTMGQYKKRPTVWDAPKVLLDPEKRDQTRAMYIAAMWDQDFGSLATSKLHHLGVPDSRICFTSVTKYGKVKSYDVFEPISRYYIRVVAFVVYAVRLTVEEAALFVYDKGVIDYQMAQLPDPRDVGLISKRQRKSSYIPKKKRLEQSCQP